MLSHATGGWSEVGSVASVGVIFFCFGESGGAWGGGGGGLSAICVIQVSMIADIDLI